VSEIKYILRMAENYETKDEESDRKRLVEALQNLKKIAPESKKKEVEQMIEIVDDKPAEEQQSHYYRKKCSIF
jgi:hypothetical protein